jgi:hypothetical protein
VISDGQSPAAITPNIELSPPIGPNAIGICLAQALTSDYPTGPSRAFLAADELTYPMTALFKRPVLRTAVLFIACVLSLLWPRLAPVTSFMVLLVGLSLPKLEGRAKSIGWGLLWASALISCLAFWRFVIEQAVPGVIAGGNAAASKHAISFARTLVTAEDQARELALFDPDHDGKGSALELAALAGLAPTRGGVQVQSGPLSLRPEQIRDTKNGPAVEEGGYLFMLCLPVASGKFVADPAPNTVDDEAAEQHYLLYGWPVSNSPGSPVQAVTVDADERISVTSPDGPRHYFGAEHGPDCDANPRDPVWTVWKGPRTSANLGAEPIASTAASTGASTAP